LDLSTPLLSVFDTFRHASLRRSNDQSCRCRTYRGGKTEYDGHHHDFIKSHPIGAPDGPEDVHADEEDDGVADDREAQE
jgi:hypothetical protein